jgi:hypothetical protein
MAGPATLKAQPRRSGQERDAQDARGRARPGGGLRPRRGDADGDGGCARAGAAVQAVHYENTIIEAGHRGRARPVKHAGARGAVARVPAACCTSTSSRSTRASDPRGRADPAARHGAGRARMGGVLMQAVTDLPVRCLPDRIPEFIDVDISHLGSTTRSTSATSLPEGRGAEIDADRTICSITPPTVGCDRSSGREAGGAGNEDEPEVIGRGSEGRGVAAGRAAGREGGVRPRQSRAGVRGDAAQRRLVGGRGGAGDVALPEFRRPARLGQQRAVGGEDVCSSSRSPS